MSQEKKVEEVMEDKAKEEGLEEKPKEERHNDLKKYIISGITLLLLL